MIVLSAILLQENYAASTPLSTINLLKNCQEALGKDGRLLIRYSGTENKIRLLVEAMDQDDVDYWTDEIKDILLKEIGK